MAAKSAIEWTESTWNPLTGCTKVSPGCKYCYAERMAKRLKAMRHPNYANGFELTEHPQTLVTPLQWKRPQVIFVNSMSDLFHRDVSESFVQDVFHTMNRANWHRYQVLTKRSERLLSLNLRLPWAPHIWMGVSVETSDYTFRIDHLRQTNAFLKFLSIEPLLAPLPNLDLEDIDWVIVGGESGPKVRPMNADWVRDIRDQCRAAGIPFFFKQWGGRNKKRAGRLLDGRTWDELPIPATRADACSNKPPDAFPVPSAPIRCSQVRLGARHAIPLNPLTY